MSRWFCCLLLLCAVGLVFAADAQTGWWPPFVPDMPVPGAATPVPAGVEALIIDGAECAGISGFRKDWDRPIPLAADGAMSTNTRAQHLGSGPVADWSHPTRPGAIACDAVHRSLLVRFPGAAERIAAAMGQGKVVVRIELVLPYLGNEVFPNPQYPDPAGMSFLGRSWAEREPRWHAVAWSLNKPWIADRDLGPTYNAYINGAGYWTGFGARVVGKDRLAATFGPAPLNKEHPEGRLDITASLEDPTFGATLGARLRRLTDCGYLVRKWEVYDASFWGSLVRSGAGYEWGTATGPRALLLGAPTLVVYLKGGAPAKAPALPPAVDVRALAKTLAGGKGGAPTAVFPSRAEIEGWIARFGHTKPAWMNEAGWSRTQQLWELEKNARHGFPASVGAYEKWFDALLAIPPRSWGGFDAAELGTTSLRYREALPAPVLEHLRLYWWAWLMPDRDYRKGFDYAGQHYQFAHGYIGHKEFADYYEKTHDWRGNYSVYRTYCYSMGTMNFNHWASAGTLLGGALLESPRIIADGRHGLADWPLKTWSWFDGSTQESIDHYYFTLSLASQKVFADFGPTVEDRLMGQAILAKSIGEIASCLHPRLKRFTASSGRTGIAHTLGPQDGLNHVLHTLLPDGALTDMGQATVGDGVPVIGHDFPPGQVGTLSLDGQWAPAWYGPAFADKPIPYQMTASYKQWGSFAQTPLWKRSYQALHYGVASLDISQGETVPFLVNWRRADAPVVSATGLGVLIGRLGLNRTELLDSVWHGTKERNPNGSVGRQGGKTCTLQHRNRLIVLATPDKGLPYERAMPATVTSIQTTLGLLSLQAPQLEILVDGKPATVPFSVKAGQRIVIRDGVALLGIVPLPGTNLGRDAEVEVTADGQPTEMQGGGKMAETLRINAYTYRGAPLPKEEWSSERVDDAWGGYCILAGDVSEYKNAAVFDTELAKGKVDCVWDAAKRRLSLSWALAGDVMACDFVPSAPAAQPTTNLFPRRTVNGQWLYPAPGIERECNLSAMGNNGQFEKNGAIFDGVKGRMGALMTDPVHGIYEAWNPFPDPTTLKLTVPGGACVQPLGMVGITRITIFARENRVEIDGAVPGPDHATVAAVSGFAAGVAVRLNGQPARTTVVQHEGKPLAFLALDGQPLPPAKVLLENWLARVVPAAPRQP